MFSFIQSKGLLIGIMLFSMVGYICSQVSTPVSTQPYFCGFEELSENVNWISDYGINNNRWTVGVALSNDGDSALYVSVDGGLTAGYNAQNGYVAVYSDFILNRLQEYEVSFEWINPSQSKLYVCFFDAASPAAQPPYSGTAVMTLPSYVKNNWRSWSGKPITQMQTEADTLMSNSGKWQKGTFRVRGTGRSQRLLFFWMNDTGTPSAKHGPGIDNVQIGRVSTCGYLGEVAYEATGNGKALLTWKVLMDAIDGSGRVDDVTAIIQATYDVRFFNGSQWVEYKDIQNPYVEIPELAAGTYKVWVRMHCIDGTTSNWYILNELYVHERIEGCLDYLDITSDAVEATYGLIADPYLNKGVINNGSGSQSSRLTVHSDREERDARTNYQLRTVPEGSNASVRLGNWGTGGEAESVTYDYTVDESTVLMLLRYAVVLQDPKHQPHEQPKFKLEVFDENMNLLDDVCGTEDFVAGGDTDDWEQAGEVRWKDWTSFGLNLASLGIQGGDKIKIRLTTYDCSLGGHYAYAYFTLDCAKAQITGVSCADGAVQPLMAPEGYNYKWYPKNNPSNIVSTTRSFLPGQNDSGIYVCELSYKDGDCSFTLEASVEPRTIIPNFGRRISYKDCKAVVNLNNTSYTTTADGLRGECDSFEWRWGDGQTSNEKDLILEFDKPGVHDITLTAMLGGECYESVTKSVDIPSFGSFVDILRVNLCAGEKYECPYNKVIYSKPTAEAVLVLDELTGYGCDSLIYLDVAVNDTFAITIEDELYLYKEPYYDFNGEHLTESGVYRADLQTACGCDSTVTLKLTAYPRLAVALQEDSVLLCGNEVAYIPLEYEIHSGAFTEYRLEFDERALAAGWTDQSGAIATGQSMIEVPVPESVRPDLYRADLVCMDEYSGVDTVDVRVVVYYSSEIIVQKWNDVLALYNAEYNGGYEFSAYQWYKNAEPIIGETGPYLYVPEQLDSEAEYQVLLTRQDDGRTVFACPVVPERRDVLDVYPTLTRRGGLLHVQTPDGAELEVRHITGLLVSSLRVDGKYGEWKAPDNAGTYFVLVKPYTGEERVFTILVE